MAYVKYTWANLPAVTTPISKANLDHLETQYDEVVNTFDANTILAANVDNTPLALTIAASRIVGRAAAGNIAALTAAEVLTLVGWTNAKLLLGAGAGVAPTEVDLPVTATKEFFAPAVLSDGAATAISDGRHNGILIDAAADNGFVEFYVPQDYTAITDAVVVFISNATATHRMNYQIQYAASGQASSTHAESVLDVDTVCADTLIYENSIAAGLSVLVAGDYVGLEIIGDATNVPNNLVLGVRFKYT